MSKLEISVLENIFDGGKIPKSHFAMLGKKTTARTELLKQMVGSFLKSGKKVLWLQPEENHLALLKKLNPYQIKFREDLSAVLLEKKSFITIDTISIDMDYLKKLLMESTDEWVIIQDDLDTLIYNYEHNEFITQKLDFLHYISEFGRAFNLYTLVAGSDVEALYNLAPSKKILINSKNLLILSQTKPSLNYLRQVNLLSNSQVESVRKLERFEALLLNK